MTRRAVALLVGLLGAPLAGLVVTALRLSGRRVGVVLLYHVIAEPTRPIEDEIVPPHEPRLFEGQLRHLKRWYRVVDASELLVAVESRRRGDRYPIAVTFDDDAREHVSTALPILRKTGLRATFFLCGASLEHPYVFWWDHLRRAYDVDPLAATQIVRDREARPPASDRIRDLAQTIEDMTAEDRAAVACALAAAAAPHPPSAGMPQSDVQALVAAGMTIGFHTLRHEPLDAVASAALATALTEGRAELESAAQRTIDAIAYPHGRTNDKVAAASRAAGFAVGFSADGFPVRPGADPLLVPRMTPSHRATGNLALHLLFALVAQRNGTPSG